MILSASAGLLALGYLSSTAVAQDPQHHFAQSFSPSLSTVRGLLVDVDHDGKLDVINGGVYNIGVLRGKGNGLFESETLFVGPTGLYDLTAGDVNGDGEVDLIASGFYDNQIRLLVGNGSGFPTAPPIQQAIQCKAVLLSDLDQDGDADLVYTARSNPGIMAVMAGNGIGGFSSAFTLSLPGAEPTALAKGEFTGDGVSDLLVAGGVPGGGFVTVLSGSIGSLQLTPGFSASAPASVLFVRPGDLNGDSLSDVAYTIAAGVPISISLGTAGGSLTPAPSLLGVGWTHAPAIADVDSDGKADLAVARSILVSSSITYGESNLYRGTGSGTFGLPERRSIGSASGYTLLEDVTRDGFVDIVTMGVGTGMIEVSPNDRTGGFHPGNAPIPLSGAGFDRAIVADFNGDQKPDAAVSLDGQYYQVAVFLSSGSAMQQVSSTQLLGGLLREGDLNGDGAIDLGSYDGLNLYPVLGDGLGNLQPLAGVPLPNQGGTNAKGIRFGDLNGDGALDAIATEGLGRQVHVVLGTGSGSFVYSNTLIAPIGMSLGDIALGDFSGDGISDVVVGGNGSNALTLQGIPSAPFLTSQSVISIWGFSYGVGSADLNADGLQDFVLTGLLGISSGTLTILKGVGLSGLQIVQSYGLSTLFGTPIFEDLDFDGNLDFAALDINNNMQVFLGDGNGAAVRADGHASVARSNITIENAVHGLFGGDWNGDGLSDLCAIKTGAVIPFYRTQVLHAGVERYGSSTAGCDGSQRLEVQQSPEVGNAGFEVHCTHAPANSVGLALLTDSLDVPGSDPFGIFVMLHVDLFAATQIAALDMPSDSAGHGSVALPIPNVAALASQTFGIQALWAWSPTICTPTPFGLSTSDALQLTPLN
ncbi:MAG: VCBS repeat-containing protein [Planctomycetes bacterium]|nr:VCBS repeat-containing protein [Planctomycetota bacterium]